MNIDPQQIRTEVDAVLAGLPPVADLGPADPACADSDTAIDDINAAGRRLEQAHQILVDALESVEKG